MGGQHSVWPINAGCGKLTLERNSTNFTTTATLRDIVTGKPDNRK
jgi:hypothetical protein